MMAKKQPTIDEQLAALSATITEEQVRETLGMMIRDGIVEYVPDIHGHWSYRLTAKGKLGNPYRAQLERSRRAK